MMQILYQLIKSYFSVYRKLSWSIRILLLAAFINAAGQMVILFISLYLKNVGFSVHTIGTIVAGYGFGGLVGGYLGGYLSDKLNPRKIIAANLLISSVFLFSLMVAAQLVSLVSILFILGLLSNAFRPAFILLLSSYADRQHARTKLFSLRRVVINLGMGCSAALGGWLASMNYHLIFLFDGVAAVITAGLFWFCLTDRAPVADLVVPTGEQNRTPADQTNMGRRKVVFYTLCLLLFVNMFVFMQLRVTYPLYLQQDYGMSLKWFSSLFTLNACIIVLFEVQLIQWVKAFNQKVIAGIGSLLMCGGLAILPYGHTMGFAYVSVLIWTVGEILFFPTMLNLVLLAASGKKGHSMGIYQTMFSLAMLIGPFVGSFLYASLEPLPFWGLCGLIGTLSLIVFVLYSMDLNVSHPTTSTS